MLHVGRAAFALWFFNFGGVAVRLVAVPVVLITLAYWFGRPQPRKWAFGLPLGATSLTLVVCGVEPAWHIFVVGRTNDGDFRARVVGGNSVTLVWAPEGPGWPREGIKWGEAVRRCRHLAADGLTLTDEPQDIWRLPTTDEAIRSMHRHGKHCGGEWDGQSPFPKYDKRPDKETPLWNVHSQVIYWWTGTEIDAEHAYMICYNGQVPRRQKEFAPAYFAFRAVKDIPED
ncbi:MAG: DUF1566 domain-containing protein [Planctomycetes bacterium]|nr:DUF1566 domain-containing protein [Planctomycetota bacterium]